MGKLHFILSRYEFNSYIFRNKQPCPIIDQFFSTKSRFSTRYIQNILYFQCQRNVDVDT